MELKLTKIHNQDLTPEIKFIIPKAQETRIIQILNNFLLTLKELQKRIKCGSPLGNFL